MSSINSNNSYTNASTSTMMAIHNYYYFEAIKCNNRGVEELQKNHLDDALINFKQALSHSKQCVAEYRGGLLLGGGDSHLSDHPHQHQEAKDSHTIRLDNDHDDDDMMEEDEDQEEEDTTPCLDELLMLAVASSDNTNNDFDVDYSYSPRTSYIHREGISIPLESITGLGTPRLGHQSCLKLSTVLIFNIALTNHLLGESPVTTMMLGLEEEGDDNDGSNEQQEHHDETSMRICFLMRAVELYGLVHGILSKKDNQQMNGPLVLLVTTNNIGMACQSLGEEQRMNQAFELLLSAMFLISSTWARDEDDHNNNNDSNSRGSAAASLGDSSSGDAGSGGARGGRLLMVDPLNFTKRFICNVMYLMTEACTAGAA